MLRRVVVKQYQIALVFYLDELREVLTKGKHWIKWNRNVQIFDMLKPIPVNDMTILLSEDPLVADLIDRIEVGPDQIGIEYSNGQFSNVLQAGIYLYWKTEKNRRVEFVELGDYRVSDSMSTQLLSRPGLSSYVQAATVEPYEKAMLYVDKEPVEILNPGIYKFWKGEKAISVSKIDMRAQTLELNGQEVLTKDKAALRINFYTGYRVTDIKKALAENVSYAKQLYVWTQVALRDYVGSVKLDELLMNKSAINDYVIEKIRTQAPALGLTIESAGVKDIILPGEVKEIMSQVLIAEKKAQAQVIMRREETASTRSLLNTAKLMENNAMLYKLKEMEYVEKIAENIQNISVSGGGQLVEQLKTIFSTSE